ncbi:adenosine deaminase-like protein [Thrips palmi]|uniref:Adenosine deaminase-like protein n=1 Tax=Thrips palmi TaxID=161013 RepID=A0A6P8Z485_THRPL|nr:adenosine deaminase-like protein [Thrips palmi]
MESFCSHLPKVELHAHLNGSLSQKVLYELYMSDPNITKSDDIIKLISSFHSGEERTLEDCFKAFDIAHAVTVTPNAVKKVTKDVICEFAADNVMYLEIRTTPRAVPGAMTKTQYIQAVIDTIQEIPTFIGPDKFIVVKLLLSVNRREGLTEAEENIKAAIAAHVAYPEVVVGVDLSGNPSCGNVTDEILPLFTNARVSGLKIALHCAEIPNEDEVEAILKFKADRLGHGTCIHPNYGGTDKLWSLFLQYRTPLEVCLTSNLKCQTVESYEKHHIQKLLPIQYPIVISTDDKAVFSTTLSEEFRVVAETFSLSKMELCNFTQKAIEVSFASSDEKKLLLDKLSDFKRQQGLL